MLQPKPLSPPTLMYSSASIVITGTKCICAPMTGSGGGIGEYSMSHIYVTISIGFNRALKQKIWPGIPSPESEFEGLFTTHKGNFQVGGLVVPSVPGLPCFLQPNCRPL